MKTLSSATRPTLLSIPEAARLLRVSERTVWSLLDAGDLPRVRLGRRITRVALADVIELVRRSTTQGGV